MDTSGIGDALHDKGEWLRYLQYEMTRGLDGQGGQSNGCRQ